MDSWILRPAGADDAAFLERLYASTRADEWGATGWSTGQIETLLSMQYAAQERHYRQHFPHARCEIVSAGGADAGRLIVERGEQFHLVDISLLPACRGRGLGTALLSALAAEADDAQRPVVLHVTSHNPARRLYERLGFEAIEAGDVYLRMRREPRRAATLRLALAA